MREQGLQTLLVHDAGRHNFLRMNYVAYLTDFISVGPDTMLVVPLDDAPVLYLAPAWDIPRAQEESWVAMSGLSRNSGRGWPSGVAKSDSSAGKRCMSGCMTRSSKRSGQTPVNAKDIIENMARCKGSFELERMRRAAAIADAGVSALHEDARPGLKEYELAAIVEYTHAFARRRR